MQTSFTYLPRFIKPILFGIGINCCVISHAQFTYDYKRNADNFYAKGDYYSAAQYYEKYLEGKADTKGFDPYEVKKTTAAKPADTKAKPATYEQTIYRIADSYYHLNDFAKAEKSYASAVNFDKTLYPDTKLNYGICLRANGKYAEAQKQFEDYLQEHTQVNAATDLAKKELANCLFIQQQQKRTDGSLYTIQKLNNNINPQGANYAPSGYSNLLVFTSTRPDSTTLINKKKSPYVNNLYQATHTDTVFTNAEKSGLPIAADAEQGVSSFTADGNKVYFTRWAKKDGKNLAAIYSATKKDGKWDEPVKLNTNINEEGYSAQQPYVSADGKYLLFASDRPGGVGKFDLWYAKIDRSAEAGKATNLGPTINTKEDDEAPFYHPQSGTLVFASKGRTGMGGFDLFESKGTVPATWAEPKNLGAPVNSVKDDIYFYNNGNGRLLKNAFLSSDRASACCLELFAADRVYRKYVSGSVTDCNTNLPVEGAVISAFDSATNKVVLVSQLTNNRGEYLFERESNQSINIHAEKAGYNIGAIHVVQTPDETDTIYNVVICQVPVKLDTPKVETVTPVTEKKQMLAHFEFNDATLREKPAFTTLDTLAALLKREPSLSLEIIGYTDEKGSIEYNIKLSEARAKACMDYLVQTGGVDAKRLSVKGLGKCCPILPETTPDGKDNPEARKVNRRVEFKIAFL